MQRFCHQPGRFLSNMGHRDPRLRSAEVNDVSRGSTTFDRFLGTGRRPS